MEPRRKSDAARRANQVIRIRTMLIMVLLGICTFLVLFGRLYILQILRHDELQAKAVDQQTRNSVILEEIYNGLGLTQDTILREDSIIYSGYSEPQALTPMDELLLKLLYHPTLRCGMTKEECDAAIRALYH